MRVKTDCVLVRQVHPVIKSVLLLLLVGFVDLVRTVEIGPFGRVGPPKPVKVVIEDPEIAQIELFSSVFCRNVEVFLVGEVIYKLLNFYVILARDHDFTVKKKSLSIGLV